VPAAGDDIQMIGILVLTVSYMFAPEDMQSVCVLHLFVGLFTTWSFIIVWGSWFTMLLFMRVVFELA
jgi:hypothetical protein